MEQVVLSERPEHFKSARDETGLAEIIATYLTMFHNAYPEEYVRNFMEQGFAPQPAAVDNALDTLHHLGLLNRLVGQSTGERHVGLTRLGKAVTLHRLGIETACHLQE